MPNCFSLTRKSALENGPVKLSQIDDEMCAYFGVEPDEVQYHAFWYDIIGFRLAMGSGWHEIRECFNKEVTESKQAGDYRHLLEIVDWLESNFTLDAWAEIGRG